jgi:hypothetical protein
VLHNIYNFWACFSVEWNQMCTSTSDFFAWNRKNDPLHKFRAGSQRYFFFRDISFQNRGKQNMRIEMSDNCLLCESPGNTKQWYYLNLKMVMLWLSLSIFSYR